MAFMALVMTLIAAIQKAQDAKDGLTLTDEQQQNAQDAKDGLTEQQKQALQNAQEALQNAQEALKKAQVAIEEALEEAIKEEAIE
jgi:uncharacterized lipoprotein NlpE involved in copper resistance